MADKFKHRNRDRGFRFYADFPPFNIFWKNLCDYKHPFLSKEYWFDHFSDKFSDGSVHPRTQVKTGQEEYTITVELPGISKDEIDLEIITKELWLQAKNERYEKNYRLHLFFRKEIKTDQIKANLKSGILTITAPFLNKEPKTKVRID
jgi:HSP20 family molecular chaperone IbpA